MKYLVVNASDSFAFALNFTIARSTFRFHTTFENTKLLCAISGNSSYTALQWAIFARAIAIISIKPATTGEWDGGRRVDDHFASARILYPDQDSTTKMDLIRTSLIAVRLILPFY